MAGGKEPIEVKFRLFDGTDIGPSKYDPSTTVAALKEFVLARWPQDKEIVPKTVSDVKLTNTGRILQILEGYWRIAKLLLSLESQLEKFQEV